jgi:hypothetical protein
MIKFAIPGFSTYARDASDLVSLLQSSGSGRARKRLTFPRLPSLAGHDVAQAARIRLLFTSETFSQRIEPANSCGND